jgi:pyruvate formate lyase activating enzyme
MMEAYLYEPQKELTVKCNLCSHRCLVRPNKRGICNVRENRNGMLSTLVYGKLIAQHVDPIEKKPLFHLLPGSRSYSIATVGCNFKCLFCQNADIAQMPSDRSGMIVGDPVSPEAVVAAAVQTGCRSISYTYTEPTVYFEFAHDTAKIAHEKGLLNVFVTNGYMTPEALRMISPYLDAANVDLKSFSDNYYNKYCGARLSPVQETLILMKSLNILVEITTLLVTGLNDEKTELESLARFIVESLGPETPWHISRFHPTYKLTDRPPTPLKSLTTARDIGLAAGLKYVYLGNVPGENGESTACPGCGRMLIERRGFTVGKNRLKEGRCPDCSVEIRGVWG